MLETRLISLSCSRAKTPRSQTCQETSVQLWDQVTSSCFRARSCWRHDSQGVDNTYVTMLQSLLSFPVVDLHEKFTCRKTHSLECTFWGGETRGLTTARRGARANLLHGTRSVCLHSFITCPTFAHPSRNTTCATCASFKFIVSIRALQCHIIALTIQKNKRALNAMQFFIHHNFTTVLCTIVPVENKFLISFTVYIYFSPLWKQNALDFCSCCRLRITSIWITRRRLILFQPNKSRKKSKGHKKKGFRINNFCSNYASLKWWLSPWRNI